MEKLGWSRSTEHELDDICEDAKIQMDAKA